MRSSVCYLHHAFLGFFHLLQIHSPHHTIHSLSFRINSLHKFSLCDLQRLKDKMAWLSDNHIDFTLQCVLFSPCSLLSIWIKQGFSPPMSGSKTSPKQEYAPFTMHILDPAFSWCRQVYQWISIKGEAIGIWFYHHAYVSEVGTLIDPSYNI